MPPPKEAKASRVAGGALVLRQKSTFFARLDFSERLRVGHLAYEVVIVPRGIPLV